MWQYFEKHQDLAWVRKLANHFEGKFNKSRYELEHQITLVNRSWFQADVVGFTTTGAAKNHDLIRLLGPKIMMIEEAGQVLESHVLASLVRLNKSWNCVPLKVGYF